MPTTSQGIYYPNSTTDVAPLHTVFSAMASSIDDILSGDVQIHKVANTTQRNALVSQFPPTTANPLFVWRADAPNGRELEYTKNGTTWYYYSSNEDDSGWVAITPASGFSSNNAAVRRIGNVVYFRGLVSGNVTSNTTTAIATVPVGFRPPANDGRGYASTTTTQGYNVYFANVTTNGTTSVRSTVSGNHNIALGPLGYLID